ncbi:MAG: riboflavin synthase [Bacillota bacterium]
MFTGLVEETGIIRSLKKGAKSAVLTVSCEKFFNGLEIGDSVAVNGVCLTVTSLAKPLFTVDVMNETLSRSSLGSLQTGSRVNLERALAADGRFGGHIVSGHIDGTGVIRSVRRDDIALRYTVQAEPRLLRYIVEKGSVALDGISLTVSRVFADSFEVSVIPHTAKATVLAEKNAGSVLNIENDIVGKYIEHFLTDRQSIETPRQSTGITEDFLLKNGF